jgi:hypothetical protein
MKSSQGPVKFVIGYWTHPGTTSVYTKGKKCQSDHGVSRSPKDIFLRPTLSIDMVQQMLRRYSSRERRGPTVEKRCYNDFLFFMMNLFFGKRKWRQENGQAWIIFKTTLYGHALNNQHNHFLVHAHSAWSTLNLHLVRLPKALQMDFFKEIGPCELDRQARPWKLAIFHG